MGGGRVRRKKRREDVEDGGLETEVQHLVVGTFHTNLYHSLRNDWPTTPLPLTRSQGIKNGGNVAARTNPIKLIIICE
jgi:hypothetical protein